METKKNHRVSHGFIMIKYWFYSISRQRMMDFAVRTRHPKSEFQMHGVGPPSSPTFPKFFAWVSHRYRMGFAWVYFMIWPVGHCGASMCLKRSISLKNDVRMGFAWPFKDGFFWFAWVSHGGSCKKQLSNQHSSLATIDQKGSKSGSIPNPVPLPCRRTSMHTKLRCAYVLCSF